jgi:signal transduction histidine kinase
MEVTAGALAAHRTMLRVPAVFRVIALVIVVTSVVGFRLAGDLTLPVLLVAVVTFAEGLVVVRVFSRARRPPQLFAVADALFCAVVLVVTARMGAAGGADPWTFLYPYVTMALLLVGAVFRRATRAAAAAAPIVGSYALCVVLLRPGGDSLGKDVVVFVGVAAAMWLLAREIRRWAQALDDAAEEAVAREAELAAERERNVYLRELHDHVLQTFETLARGRFVTDDRMRGHVARQAFRLRRIVETGRVDGGSGVCDLTDALVEVAEENIEQGLAIDLQTTRLRDEVPGPVAAALAAAVGEALTNVRKHSGVQRAVVQAVSTPADVTVTVLDRGRGFDPSAPTTGTGLRESVRARVVAVGGTVRVDSAGDGGTCVVLEVPLAGPAAPSSTPAPGTGAFA